MNSFYVVLGILGAIVGTIGYVRVRRHYDAEPDRVSQSALDRIRTEYR